MTGRDAGRPANGRGVSDLTPSEQKIHAIESNYIGANYDPPKKMVSSDDVKAAIAALDERHGPDLPGRIALADFSPIAAPVVACTRRIVSFPLTRQR
jgi:hypothetical protein